MIFQHFNLLSSRTVSGNIAFPLELDRVPQSEIKRRVAELLALVGLEEKQNDYPASLSGGQKQRVAIARALSSNPKVLLCDEATSALDPATTRSILDLLKDINRRLHITILLITHEMDVVKAICDEVAVISEGRLIEQGPVSAIFSHPQTGLAKEFIASTIKITLPNDYKLRLSSENGADKRPILRLEFTGESTDEAALSNVSRQFDIDHRIVCGQMDFAAGVKFGVIITEVDGTPENMSKALTYYKSKYIKAEVLGYV
jgi:D-methionine transport system ATP-binding protein